MTVDTLIDVDFFIDLTKPGSPSTDEVARLLASRTDKRHWQIQVTTAGIVTLSPPAIRPPDNQFSFEIFLTGNDWVGGAASQDMNWVRRVRDALDLRWHAGFRGVLDVY